MKYVPAIDGLRAIAILIVLASHFVTERIPGGLGVTLFFFISGYLITRLLLDEHAKTKTIAIGTFYVRRFRRLAPALVAMVSIVTAFYWFSGRPTSASETSAALLYYMNYYTIADAPMPVPLGPLWSLAIEEHYYLIYPIIFTLCVTNKRAFLWTLLGTLVAVLIWRIALALNGADAWRIYVATDTRIDSIVFGAALAVAIDLFGIPSSKATWTAFAGAVLILLLSTVIRVPWFRTSFAYTAQGLALVPLFCLAMFEPRFSIARRAMLENPVAIWIGKISYSLYLWHFPIFITLTGKLTQPLAAMVALPLSLAAAAASYYWIEVPLRAKASNTVARPALSTP